MTALLDVNVLLALAWHNHIHYDIAWAWFEVQREKGWATCPLTEAGFVRLSCNPSAMQYAVTPLEAIAVLEALTRLGNRTFWPLDRSIARFPESTWARLQGYRQVTDAVLLATAMQRGGQLATLDMGIERLVSEKDRPFLHVIPV